MSGDTLTSTFWLMVILQTIGSVDMPGQGARKMPAPRAYVAIVIMWASLELAAGLGYQQAAATTSKVLVLTGAVVGPFGQRLAGFLSSAANIFSTPPAQ